MQRRGLSGVGAVVLGLWGSVAHAGQDVVVHWSAAQDSLVGLHNPLLADGEFVFYSMAAGVVQAEAGTGKVVRSLATPGCSGPLMDVQRSGDYLLVVCENAADEESYARGESDDTSTSTLQVIRLSTGKLAWGYSGAFLVPLGVHQQKLVLAEGLSVVLKDLSTGGILWQKKGLDPMRLAPVIGGAEVFVLDRLGQLTAWQATSGKRLWRRNLPGQAVVPPTVGATHLFVPMASSAAKGGQTPKLWALSRRSGKVAWHKRLKGDDFLAPTLATPRGIFVPMMERLYAFHPKTGRSLWQVQLAGDGDGTDFMPVLHQGKLLIWSGSVEEQQQEGISSHYDLLALDAKRGKQAWKYRLPEGETRLLSRAHISSGMIVFSDGEKVRALRLTRK